MTQDRRESFRIPYPFSFHHNEEVLEGVNLSLSGFGVLYQEDQDGNFHFKKSQQLKDCYIQVEGETIYFSRLRVCWLNLTKKGLVYGFQIESIVPPELAKYERAYEKVIQQIKDSEALSAGEREVLEQFYSER